MKVKYKQSRRIDSIGSIFRAIFSISYFDNDESRKALTIVFLNREWYWAIGKSEA